MTNSCYKLERQSFSYKHDTNIPAVPELVFCNMIDLTMQYTLFSLAGGRYTGGNSWKHEIGLQWLTTVTKDN